MPHPAPEDLIDIYSTCDRQLGEACLAPTNAPIDISAVLVH